MTLLALPSGSTSLTQFITGSLAITSDEPLASPRQSGGLCWGLGDTKISTRATLLRLSLKALLYGDPTYISGRILPLPYLYLLIQPIRNAHFLRTPEPATTVYCC